MITILRVNCLKPQRSPDTDQLVLEHDTLRAVVDQKTEICLGNACYNGRDIDKKARSQPD